MANSRKVCYKDPIKNSIVSIQISNVAQSKNKLENCLLSFEHERLKRSLLTTEIYKRGIAEDDWVSLSLSLW